MYCILCFKRKTRSKQNQADIFTGKPGKRHRNLHYNHMLTLIVTRQPLKQSYCRKILSLLKDWQIKLLRETGLCSLLLCQHISWQNMEVANSKLLSLLKLLDTSGVKHIKYFSYKGEETLRDIFLTIGEVIQDTIIKQATQAGCYGILMVK